jgi:nucleoside-diphosphate-sugar epimerase
MKKQVLILGGTMFAGRALVERLLTDERYAVTLSNRGKSNSDIFPMASKLHGNRETDDILKVCNQAWDVVVDFSGYYPLTFAELLNKLSGKVRRYIFISTISVFPKSQTPHDLIAEEDEIFDCSKNQLTSPLPDAYGEKKAEMERILLAHPDMDPIIFRPSFIYGRYDWTDRFYYWIYRAYKSDKVLLPSDEILSLTYVEDLVEGLLRALEVKEHRAYYNAITHRNVSLSQVLHQAAQLLHREVEIVPAPQNILEEHKIERNAFPLALPFALQVEGESWLNDLGISPTPFLDTLQQTIQYAESIAWPEPKASLSFAKEQEVISNYSKPLK